MNPFPRAWIEIDLPAFRHNLSLVRGALPAGCLFALVAKADAYGHGLVPIAREAVRHGVDWIAVATVQEGIALRDAGLRCPVIVLSPILEIEAEQAVFYDLRIMVERGELGRALSQAAVRQQRPAVVHLPVDTGVARFGVLPVEVGGLLAELRGLPGVVVEGIGTHFADSGHDEPGTREQMRLFAEALSLAAPPSGVHPIRRDGAESPAERGTRECPWAGAAGRLMVHVANSAGALAYPDLQLDLVRVGIAAYGIDPYGMLGGQLRPILSWKARIMSLRERPTGSRLSYSGTYTCTRPTRIATLGVGYGDGYPRSLSNSGFVEIRGRRAPVVGLVCMDQVLIDVTDLPEVAIGDEVLLIGGEATVARLAECAGTNVHEIVTRIMSRAPRRYKH